MPRCVTLMICICLSASYAVADMMRSDALVTLEAGVLCPPETTGATLAPDTLAGATHVIDVDPPFVSRGRIVPAALGVGFGIKAQSVLPDGITTVTARVTHPPMGPEGRTAQSFVTTISGQTPSVTFYQFDHRYELVTGTWTIAGYDGGEQLFSVSFEVVAPATMPDLAGACRFSDLLS